MTLHDLLTTIAHDRPREVRVSRAEFGKLAHTIGIQRTPEEIEAWLATVQPGETLGVLMGCALVLEDA